MSDRNRLCVALFVLLAGGLAAAEDGIRFADVTDEAGLAKHLKNWCVAHGAAWGDVDGDGRPDLYLAAYADRPLYRSNDGPIPNQLFLDGPGGFAPSTEESVRLAGRHARTTMPLFVDMDHDGDLDLIVGNHAAKTDECQSMFFENLGVGRFREAAAKGVPTPWAVRNISALDFNGDGLLDLILTDGNYDNWRNGGGRLLLLLNKGGWQFEDAGARYGFPDKGTAGMGLAVGDVNNDGVFDIFVADSNMLFLSAADGRYSARKDDVFVKWRGGEAHPCGAAFGDLNGDDLLDLVITVHGQPGEFHVYLNKGVHDGIPEFARIAGGKFLRKGFKTGLAVKAAQTAVCDMDNDGREDVFIAVVRADADGTPQPLVLRNEGNDDNGAPRLNVPPLDRCMGYYAPGPVCDYDRDGRLDIFLPTWFEELPCYLFRNTTQGGHWLAVRVKGKGAGLNSMGIGATVRVHETGKEGGKARLLGRHDISIGNGYSSGEEALAHFGLGDIKECDVVVRWSGHEVKRTGVQADQLITIDVAAGE